MLDITHPNFGQFLRTYPGGVPISEVMLYCTLQANFLNLRYKCSKANKVFGMSFWVDTSVQCIPFVWLFQSVAPSPRT